MADEKGHVETVELLQNAGAVDKRNVSVIVPNDRSTERVNSIAEKYGISV
jgi:hypothetical protein